MKRFKTILLSGLICVILAGCGNEFAEKEYNDTDKIAAKEDRYAKTKSVANSIDNVYTLEVQKFDGRETICTKNIKKSKDIDIEIKLSLSEGTAKIVLVNEDGEVSTIIECTQDDCVAEGIVKTVSLKKGVNRFKIVGYGCKNLDLEWEIAEDVYDYDY